MDAGEGGHGGGIAPPALSKRGNGSGGAFSQQYHRLFTTVS